MQNLVKNVNASIIEEPVSQIRGEIIPPKDPWL